MKTKLIIRTAIVAVFAMVSFSSVKAQLNYKESHLFIGPMPTQNTAAQLGTSPAVYIGQNFGIESYDNGLNFWKPYPASYK